MKWCVMVIDKGCVPRVCIGYITNGFNDFATVDGNGPFLRNCLCFEEREQCLKVIPWSVRATTRTGYKISCNFIR